jgi:hypothetical protein
MIGPYGSAIELYVTRFSGLGYLKSPDTDYEVVFSNGAYRVSFSTEKYYHPSVAVTLIDSTGEKFVMAFVREILAPAQFAKELEELKGVRSRYHLDGQGTDKDTWAAGIEAYMSLLVEHVCSFLSALGGDKFTADETFLTRYRELERARLKPFGL